MVTAEHSAGATRKEWGVLLGLVTVLCLEVLGWAVTRRTDLELRASLAAASGREAVGALHVLLNRGEAPSIDPAEVKSLLASDEPLLREMAMTSDVWRLAGRALQRDDLKRTADEGEAVRGRYYLKRHGQPVRRSALREYFRSLEPGQ
jgi:hypothetical protein